MYARAFLEGRLNTNQLDKFRQEVGKNGLSSYPHPWLMPNFLAIPYRINGTRSNYGEFIKQDL